MQEQPVVVSAPDTAGRYYMLPMLDMWTDVFAVVGSRTTGTAAGLYAIVGPGWSGGLPSGVEGIESPTPHGWIIGRTQTNGPADYEAVHAVQDGFIATPLSQWPGAAVAAASPADPSVDMKTPPRIQVEAMSGVAFMTYGAALMSRHRPHLTDQPILARMARLGFRPGEPFSADQASADVLAAIEAAPASAQRRMTEAEPRLSPVVNGWGMPTFGMGVYGTDYLRRALVARVGLGANLVEDAIYPVLYADETGSPPSGDNRYLLRFDAGSLPPADAFWSITMYDGDGFPVPNAIERYAIGDRDPLHHAEDGSLTIYIQHDDPGDELRSNWLPAPRGPLGITLRIYGTRPEALDGRWAPPPLVRA